MLAVKNLSVRYGPLVILNDIEFSVGEGRWLMVVGSNGAGKSTLIGAVSQDVPYTGDVLFQGRNINGRKPSALARDMGVLMQNHNVGYSFTVEEVVRLGRYAYSGGIFSAMTDEDEAKIEEALASTGMLPIRGQSVLTLSGGELQRTFLAQLLAQDPKLLLLDEPSNHLDLVYQKQMFELIREWLKKPGRAVLSVVHDLNLAKAFGTDALLLHRGKIEASGEAAKVLTGDMLKDVYGMDVAGWMRMMLAQWEESR